MEVSIKNLDGTWVTTTTADLGAAATQLFNAGGWPANPTADFSGLVWAQFHFPPVHIFFDVQKAKDCFLFVLAS